MAAIDTALLVSLFHSSSVQGQRQARPVPPAKAIRSPWRQPRVGVVIDTDGLSGTLPVGAIADRLAAEPGIIKVSAVERASSAYVGQFVRANELDRLVVGGQYVDWLQMVSPDVLGRVKPEGTGLRVVDLGRLCTRVHKGEEATAKAFLLLLAAVARVRWPDALSRAAVEAELAALLARGDVNLWPRVVILACPGGFASLRMIGQIGRQYLPGALPVEVPCYLNRDRRLTARALELGATAVLLMGCDSGCLLGYQPLERQAEGSNGQHLLPVRGEERPLETMMVSRLSDLAKALDACLNRV